MRGTSRSLLYDSTKRKADAHFDQALRVIASEKQLDLKASNNLPEMRGGWVSADRRRLKQILFNLLGNACVSSPLPPPPLFVHLSDICVCTNMPNASLQYKIHRPRLRDVDGFTGRGPVPAPLPGRRHGLRCAAQLPSEPLHRLLTGTAYLCLLCLCWRLSSCSHLCLSVCFFLTFHLCT
jgi:hypothetical protein